MAKVCSLTNAQLYCSTLVGLVNSWLEEFEKVKAKKLKSGSWRCQVYVGREKVTQPDGTVKEKEIRKSFTISDPSPAGKKECERIASAWAAEHEHHDVSAETVREAIQRYVDDKHAVLSPATIRGYMATLRCHMDMIAETKLSALTERTVQKWVNSLVDQGLSPKTVKNTYGLLSTVLDANGIRFRITLPQQVRPDLYVPSDADIQTLIDYFRDNDKDMLCAVYLAAFGSLRRSEVCALDASDIDGNTVHVRRAMVPDQNGRFVTKTTKTYSSTRDVVMPDFIIKELPTFGRIVSYTPQQVTDHFRVALRHLDIPHFRFHDLRHYTASIMHALGIPDVYIMQRGGWSNDGTLKRIYRNSMDDYEKKFNDILMEHFSEISSHESSHEN